MKKDKFHYRCVDCDSTYASRGVRYLCPACENQEEKGHPPLGILKVEYEYDDIRRRYGKSVSNKLSSSGFLDLLPINSMNSMPNLRVGSTPLYFQKELEEKSLPFRLWLKDDSQNPTYSFKDRASALVCAYAKENNIDTIIAASTGNAGSSLAGICASTRQKAVIFVPEAAPLAKLTQIVMYGAKIVPVAGNYDMAFDLSIEATKKHGFYNRNTAFNPMTIEGKKTVSFELYQQMAGLLPDRIFVPVGDGVIISGVYKGFEDLLRCKLIQKIPEIVAVQAEGSANIINNLHSSGFVSKPGQTIADSISVDIPRNYHMAKKFLRNYKGTSVSVTDNEIVEASVILSRNTGIFSEPAAAAAFAGMLKFHKAGKIKAGSDNVVLLTGSGLKDLNAVKEHIKIPKSVKDLSEIKF